MQNKIIEACRTAIAVSFTALYVTCVAVVGHTLYSLWKSEREEKKQAKVNKEWREKFNQELSETIEEYKEKLKKKAKEGSKEKKEDE